MSWSACHADVPRPTSYPPVSNSPQRAHSSAIAVMAGFEMWTRRQRVSAAGASAPGRGG
jgi:hypothetical protein